LLIRRLPSRILGAADVAGIGLRLAAPKTHKVPMVCRPRQHGERDGKIIVLTGGAYISHVIFGVLHFESIELFKRVAPLVRQLGGFDRKGIFAAIRQTGMYGAEVIARVIAQISDDHRIVAIAGITSKALSCSKATSRHSSVS
jgi:hypothetical protein